MAAEETDEPDNDHTGDGRGGIGPFRIKIDYWMEAVAYDSNLTANGETYLDCMGEGGVEYSQRVVQVQ